MFLKSPRCSNKKSRAPGLGPWLDPRFEKRKMFELARDRPPNHSHIFWGGHEHQFTSYFMGISMGKYGKIVVLLVGGCNKHLEKYEFVDGKDDIPYMTWKITHVWNHQPDLPAILVFTQGHPAFRPRRKRLQLHFQGSDAYRIAVSQRSGLESRKVQRLFSELYELIWVWVKLRYPNN